MKKKYHVCNRPCAIGRPTLKFSGEGVGAEGRSKRRDGTFFALTGSQKSKLNLRIGCKGKAAKKISKGLRKEGADFSRFVFLLPFGFQKGSHLGVSDTGSTEG